MPGRVARRWPHTRQATDCDSNKHVESHCTAGKQVPEEDPSSQNQDRVRFWTIDGGIKRPQNSDNVPGKLHDEYCGLHIEDNIEVFAGRWIGHGPSGTDKDGSDFDEAHDNVNCGEDAQVEPQQLLILTLVASVVGV